MVDWQVAELVHHAQSLSTLEPGGEGEAKRKRKTGVQNQSQEKRKVQSPSPPRHPHQKAKKIELEGLTVSKVIKAIIIITRGIAHPICEVILWTVTIGRLTITYVIFTVGCVADFVTVAVVEEVGGARAGARDHDGLWREKEEEKCEEV